MQFVDARFTHSLSNFQRLFNEIGYNAGGAKGSVRDFYAYASDGQLDYITDVYGPYTARRDMAYYGANSGQGHDRAPLELTLEAINNLPDSVDLSQYDNDGDGYVDNIHIIYAGYGEEAGANANAIWAHEYPSVLPISVRDMRFRGYSCSPELRSNYGDGITRIGVICHELGHALGAMDYYDVDYNVNGDYEGTGVWDLMAQGSWNKNGVSPACFNPYVRAYNFGWSEVETLNANGTYVMNNKQKVYRLDTKNKNDYYLLENRSRQSFDEYLPGEGMLIYHHHPDLEMRAKKNLINNTHPQGLYPVCTNLTETPLETKRYGDVNSAACAFPYGGVNSFSAKTTPAAFAWDGSDVSFAITNIRRETSGQITFKYSHNGGFNGDAVTGSENVGFSYLESFEHGIKGFETKKFFGDRDWMVYPSNVFLMETNLIPDATDGKRLLMLFAGNKGGLLHSRICSPEVRLSADSIYTFSLDCQIYTSPTNIVPSFSVELFSNDSLISTTEVKPNENAKWQQVVIDLPCNLENLRYRFVGKVDAGGIFVDNVKLTAVPNFTGLNDAKCAEDFSIKIENGSVAITSDVESNCDVFTVTGLKLYGNLKVNAVAHTIELPKGVYIIRRKGGKGTKVLIP